LKTARHVAVPREDPRAALRTLARTADLLRGGRSTLVFPEGGRTATGELQPFKDGAAFVAIRAGIPIVPMALIGIRKVLPMHSTVFRRAAVALRVGEPVSTAGLTIKDREKLTQTLRERVASLSADGSPGSVTPEAEA
jgi:1-acyl-sn-glycerol-3-phosphate acyltransferase